MENEQFFDYIKQLKKCNKNNLHIIDQALLLLEDYLSIKWYNLLFRMGINYTTPAIIITNEDDWATYSNFGKNTTLMINSKGFKITSNNETISYKGTSFNKDSILKDKKHKKSILIVFDHTITSEQFYKEIL